MRQSTSFFLFGLLMLLLTGCESKNKGPFFGNGFHNGWADQNSIVIWTRLTNNPDLNRTGPGFIIPSANEMRRLDKGAIADSINKAQLPDGFTLDQMEGACPGMEGEVKLYYFPLHYTDRTVETEWIAVEPDKNFTRQWKLTNLDPDTKYVVKIEARKIKGKKITSTVGGAFRTPPDSTVHRDLTFCITTCQDYPRRDDSINGHKIYKSMLKLFPDFFIHTGDIEYYDKPGPYALTEELMRFKWNRLFALPYQRNFYKQVTTYYMKDDHDALTNDAFPGMTYGTVSWERGLEIFDKEQFPSNSLPYKTIRWGRDLQIWITEGRNYRSKNTDPDGPGKTIWGKEQKDWLFKTLNESDATFKLIISPDPLLGPDRNNKGDNYANEAFKYEGDEIREFLKQFDNVFICNGDRHWQYVTNIQGTTLWEFGCGASSDMHAEGWKEGDVRPEHRFLRIRGGFLKGEVSSQGENSVLKLQHLDVDGNIVHEETFSRKQVL